MVLCAAACCACNELNSKLELAQKYREPLDDRVGRWGSSSFLRGWWWWWWVLSPRPIGLGIQGQASSRRRLRLCSCLPPSSCSSCCCSCLTICSSSSLCTPFHTAANFSTNCFNSPTLHVIASCSAMTPSSTWTFSTCRKQGLGVVWFGGH